jgi:hypothetical protein
MTTSIDIARELLLIWISGTHGDGAIADNRCVMNLGPFIATALALSA